MCFYPLVWRISPNYASSSHCQTMLPVFHQSFRQIGFSWDDTTSRPSLPHHASFSLPVAAHLIRLYTVCMPKRVKLQEYLSLVELEQQYRQAKDPVERSQWQILWLLAKGSPSEQVAQVTGYSLNWIRRIAQRYNTAGAAGVQDQRHRNPGAAPLLSAAQQEELRAVLQAALERESLWTGPQVAAWIATKVGHPVYPQRGWEWLRRLGFDPRMARPRQPRSPAGSQSVLNKRSPLSTDP